MALIKCIECGQIVSDKALACPHCGCPVERQTAGAEQSEFQDEAEKLNYGSEQSVNVGQQEHSVQEYYYEAELDEDESDWEKDMKRRKKIRWILLAAAVILAIVAADVWFYQQTKPDDVDKTTVSNNKPIIEYTVAGVAADLLTCEDEATAITLLDGIKAKALEFLNNGDEAGYFKIINILRMVWRDNKDAIIAKFPGLVEKMTGYLNVPSALKANFAEFLAKTTNGSVIDPDIDIVVDENVTNKTETYTQHEERGSYSSSPKNWTGASSIDELRQKLDGTYWHGQAKGILHQFHFINGKIYYKTAIGGTWSEEYVYNTYEIKFHRTNTMNFLAVEFGNEGGERMMYRERTLAFANKCMTVIQFQFGNPVCQMEYGEHILSDEL